MPRQVLVLSPYYLPGYRAGGALRSLANVVHWLGEEADFSIITRGHDLGEATPYPDVELGAWNRVDAARVHYLDPAVPRRKSLRAAWRDQQPDLVYLVGFFSPLSNFYLWERLRGRTSGAPVVLAPHGEFSAGALGIRGWKKRTFLRLARLLGLHRGVRFLATTPLEDADIQRVLGDVERLPMPYLPPREVAGLDAPFPPKHAGRLRLVFCSRVSPKKNLHGALEMLAKLRGTVRLDIYGSLAEEAYVRRCRAMAAALPDDKEVVFHGEITHEEVAGRVREADYFLLPTLGENFGFAIVEALLAGTPVLISDTTPWRGLAEAHAGHDLPLADSAAWTGVLQAAVDMGEAEHAALREGALAFPRSFIDAPALQTARSLFVG